MPNLAAPVQLNILIRGQSNAVLLGTGSQGGYSALIVQAAQSLLGFDGVNQRINVVFDTTPGLATAANGTSLLRQWLSPISGDWHNGWTTSTYENGLLAKVASLSAAQRAAPTAIVWLHNEADSVSYVAPDMSEAQWESAVRFDAATLRAALGQTAATTPYLFVDAIPSPAGVPKNLQGIRQGMETLAEDPAFNAVVAAQSIDVDMGTAADSPSTYGGNHLVGADFWQLASRLAASVAEAFAGYAQPGSPMATAGGDIANTGPEVIAALLNDARTMTLSLGLDHAAALMPLDAAAAAGLGWSVQTDKGFVAASGAALVGGTLKLTFAGDVHLGDTLFYGYGYGRLAAADGTGERHAVYDANGLPIWASAYGVTLGAAADYPAAPTAAADRYQAMEEQVLTVSAAAGLLANDVDPAGLSLHAILETGPSHGRLALNPDGSFV